ncbi:MAG: alpha/beta fold hydrolase [Anaerolineae bacterium]|nr:alpha/beta fold hydrolase [Anaerolineae bacterium]
MNLKILLVVIVLLLLSTPMLAQDEQLPRYEVIEGCFTNISIELDYECGYVTVPEFYDGRTDGEIRLAVVRIFATGDGETRSPVFFMDGGPGGSLLLNLGLDQYSIATELEAADDPEAATPLLDMLQTRDFVLFSQRGTQFSEPVLVCEAADELDKTAVIQGLDFETQLERSRSAYQSCVDAYVAEGIDLNAFTNFANADDVNAVRESLGYDQIVFYGESYGAQLGLHVMQRHPEILEAAILDGVAAVSKVAWVQGTGPVLEQAINSLLALCAEDETCAAKLENPETLLTDAFARVQEEPITATYTSADGSSFEFDVTPEILAVYLETLFVETDIRPSIPLMLSELRDGDASLFASAIGDEATRPDEEAIIAWLMHAAMVCSDDPPQREPNYDTSSYSDLALFAEQVFSMSYIPQCETLNVERLSDESDLGVSADVPTLILGGGLDVRTPVVENQEVADMLPNSRLITFEYSDHVQYRGDYAPCAASIVSAFVVDPASLDDLDASCTDSVLPPNIKLPDPTIADVIGTEFVSTGVYVGPSEEYLPIPEGNTYTITFTDVEQLVIIADCNTVNASYAIGDDKSISIELGASTLMACPEGSIADDFLAVIESTSEVNLVDIGSGIVLVLMTEDESSVAFNASN